jgi:hypothetical protein
MRSLDTYRSNLLDSFRLGLISAGALLAVLTAAAPGCSSSSADSKISALTPSPILTMSAGTTSFIGPSTPVAVDPNLTLTGSDPITGARVVVVGGFVSAQDSLVFTDQNGITGSFAASTGILTLTGSASSADYETALKSVSFANSAGPTPAVGTRQISFSIIGATSLFFGDHYYEFVSGSITWTAARTAAALRTFSGLQGYLLTVTGVGENSFIASKLTATGWMGASDAATEGTWRWVTGPEGLEAGGLGRNFFNQSGGTVSGSYSSWAGGEPNNSGNEDYAQFYAGSTGLWNDLPNISIAGYVAEYGGTAGDPVLQISGTKDLSVAAGCALDSQCATGKYCDPVPKVCKTALAAGEAIPGDTLHNGTCTPTNASAVCATSACNTTLNTCASTNGSSCTSAAMCVSDVCGSNGSCGAVTGATGCTLATASAYCQSGVCSSSGVCIPAAAGSCYVDGDCNSGFFCRRDLYSCRPVLNVGVEIPDDGLHGALCSTTVAMAVCNSGACNPTTNTCANTLGSTCSGAGDCTVNLCGTNGKCGNADGSGTCSAGTAAVLCQSLTCSTGSVCMPAGADRCWVDADCPGASYCDRVSTRCSAKLAAGAPIPDDGLHDATCVDAAAVCASGLCNGNTNTCAGVNGSVCVDGAACVGNTCGNNGRCGIAVGDGACTPDTAAAVCQSGRCSAASVCQPATVGGCWVDADCGASEYCAAMALECQAKLGAGGALPIDRLHDGICASALAATVCSSGNCNPVTNTCAGAAGAACTSADLCVVNVCNAAGSCGFDLGAGTCQSNNALTQCASGLCSSAGVCLSSVAGSCWADADCPTNSFCARATATCHAKLAGGTPLLTDAIHDGQCTDALALAVCATGACNTLGQTCSSAVGTRCTGPGECTNNTCGNNLKCGLTTGAGPCTTQNATELCQSGVCGPQSGVCVPSGTGGCGTDADCSAPQFCDGIALTCLLRLGTGTSLPSDGKHGVCLNGRNSACGTGLCNGMTNTCANPNGTTCTQAQTCVSNVCGRNGKCGLDDGQPGCTVVTASVCQTGVCTATGVCGTLGCATDAGCPVASAFCDASVGLCKAKLEVGQMLPSDSVHDGECNSSLSGAVCATGTCNATTKTCALANAEACHTDGECAINACGADGMCGLADGESGCTTATATLCRSGLCSPKGNRCLPTGIGRCAVDTDCAGATFCAPATLSCVARLANGTAIPKDGLHGDGCLPGNATAVCVSGLCNPVTTTCAGPTGGACTKSGECANGVCGANGLCGKVDGTGPCDDATGAALCQSGLCNARLGLCKPKAPGACLEDTDCGADSFCAPTSLSCTKKLSAGATIPSDGSHGGVCDKATAKAVCVSELCNPQTNTCAAANSDTCSSASACVSGICSADGICGKAAGATCDRAGDCRSAACTAGVCAGLAAHASVTGDGCGCRLGGTRANAEFLLLALLAVGFAASRRRR